MIFRDFALRWLGSKAKLRIVLHLLSGSGPSTERELARRIGLSHVAVGKALKDLESVNFLRKDRIGTANVWSVNEKGYAYLVAKDLEALAQTPPLRHLVNHLTLDLSEKAYPQVKRVVLFGSIIEGKEEETSDIDVFLQIEGLKDKEAVLRRVLELSEKYQELYGNPISPIIMTGGEAKRNRQLIKNVERGVVIR